MKYTINYLKRYVELDDELADICNEILLSELKAFVAYAII